MNSRVKSERIIEGKRKPSNVSLYPGTKEWERLVLTQHIREFASANLALPRNKSYLVYADTKGGHLQWNLVAAPAFSVEPLTWCFPFAGCVVYRGYFSHEKIIKYAEGLRQKGYDILIYPVTAYSTLGWFNDPILYNHLKLDEISLAGLIFHELAHQQLYRKGDSRFSESFAVTVEREGVIRWLRATGRDSLVEVAQKRWQERELHNAAIIDARKRLAKLYSEFESAFDLMVRSSQNPATDLNKDQHRVTTGNLTKEMKLAAKDSLMTILAKELGEDPSEINNAWFIPSATYYSLLPRFRELLDSCGGDLEKFYREAEKVSFR
ncbi:MAG: aminopeptidase [Bacteroidales bacterium]|nr:aminopeptidase [Bacteroidales bacterium]